MIGMYGGLDFILEVCCLRGVMNGRVQVGYNNDKSLFLSFKKVQRVRQQRKHADILQTISNVQTSIPLEMEFNHIRGHQDESIPAQLLDC